MRISEMAISPVLALSMATAMVPKRQRKHSLQIPGCNEERRARSRHKSSNKRRPSNNRETAIEPGVRQPELQSEPLRETLAGELQPEPLSTARMPARTGGPPGKPSNTSRTSRTRANTRSKEAPERAQTL
jgi:hypothetical protein